MSSVASRPNMTRVSRQAVPSSSCAGPRRISIFEMPRTSSAACSRSQKTSKTRERSAWMTMLS